MPHGNVKPFIIFFICVFFAVPAIAGTNGAGRWIDEHLDAGFAYEQFYLGIEPDNYDYEISSREFWVGGRNGTRFFSGRTETDINKYASVTRFDSTVQMDEYGFKAGWRLAAMNRQRFALGFGRKDIDPTSFIEYSYSNACLSNPAHPGEPCQSPLTLAGVHSNPVYFDYEYDMAGPWRAGFSYVREKIELEATAEQSVVSNIYTFSGGRQWRRFALDLSFTKLSSGKAPDNTGLEMHLAYTPVEHIEISFLLGAYFNGLPAGGGNFSDLGEKFLFDYIVANDFQQLYSEKFGYYALGVTISL